MTTAIIGRQQSVVIDLDASASGAVWPALEPIWKRRHVSHIQLNHSKHSAESDHEFAKHQAPDSGDWRPTVQADEKRPERHSLVLQSTQVAVGYLPTAQLDEPPPGIGRVLVLDASWTHIARFPDREEVRDEFTQAFRHPGPVHYVTNLPWDAALFGQVAREQRAEDRANTVLVLGYGEDSLSQARRILNEIQPNDLVLIGLVPGRDDRGAFQRLRSDFAERTPRVQAFPASPLSCGPGASREEALAAVGMWLPTRVLIAGGPISEQHLLARHLEESTGGSPAVVGLLGGEYRLPSLELLRHHDAGQRSGSGSRLRLRAAQAGLVVATHGFDGAVSLSGAGLAPGVSEVLLKIRINPRGKTPEQVVREIESAFTSRSIPVPAIRYLP